MYGPMKDNIFTNLHVLKRAYFQWPLAVKFPYKSVRFQCGFLLKCPATTGSMTTLWTLLETAGCATGPIFVLFTFLLGKNHGY